MRPRGQTSGGIGRVRRRLIGTLAAAAALLVLPTSADAFDLSGLVAQPVGTNATQAGAHKDFHIHMDFANGQVKDLTVGLPPGMVGNPNATPLCTVDQLNADSCPANTKVGSVIANATITVLLLPATLDVRGDLYNLTPQPGDPARFGIVLRPLDLGGVLPNPLPPIILQSAVQLRPDLGLNTVINMIPNKTVADGDTTINSQDITLFGSRPWMSAPFMRNPTSCDHDHTTTFSATPYSGASASGAGDLHDRQLQRARLLPVLQRHRRRGQRLDENERDDLDRPGPRRGGTRAGKGRHPAGPEPRRAAARQPLLAR